MDGGVCNLPSVFWHIFNRDPCPTHKSTMTPVSNTSDGNSIVEKIVLWIVWLCSPSGPCMDANIILSSCMIASTTQWLQTSRYSCSVRMFYTHRRSRGNTICCWARSFSSVPLHGKSINNETPSSQLDLSYFLRTTHPSWPSPRPAPTLC
jgi:hypothetical protein